MRCCAEAVGQPESDGCTTRRVAFPVAFLCGPSAWLLAGAGYGTSDRFASLRHEMQRADLVWDMPAHLHKGHGIERRAIGREAHKRAVACLQGCGQAPQQGPEGIVIGGVVADVIAHTLLATLLDRGEHAQRAVVSLLGGHIP